MSDFLQRARDALTKIAAGRAELADIAKAVKDSAAAISTNDAAELDRMLQRELEESRAAFQETDDILKAIAEGRG